MLPKDAIIGQITSNFDTMSLNPCFSKKLVETSFVSISMPYYDDISKKGKSTIIGYNSHIKYLVIIDNLVIIRSYKPSSVTK